MKQTNKIASILFIVLPPFILLYALKWIATQRYAAFHPDTN